MGDFDKLLFLSVYSSGHRLLALLTRLWNKNQPLPRGCQASGRRPLNRV